MLLERAPSESIEEHSHLNQELKDYKKANYSLRKKLKEKEAKIQYTCPYLANSSVTFKMPPRASPSPPNQP